MYTARSVTDALVEQKASSKMAGTENVKTSVHAITL